MLDRLTIKVAISHNKQEFLENNHAPQQPSFGEQNAEIFTAYTKSLQKYLTYTSAFEDFSSALDALSNARLTHQIIDPITLERYFRAIAYYPQIISPNYELVSSHTYIYYTEPLASFTNFTDQFLFQIPILLKYVL